MRGVQVNADRCGFEPLQRAGNGRRVLGGAEKSASQKHNVDAGSTVPKVKEERVCVHLRGHVASPGLEGKHFPGMRLLTCTSWGAHREDPLEDRLGEQGLRRPGRRSGSATVPGT